MRISIFATFLNCFKQVKEFPLGTVRPELIAQHYGFKTPYLDLTDDFKVAMFFACCRHDVKNNIFRPITKDDILEMGEYGVIYMGHCSDMMPAIGCQPFCRCHRQRGYYLDTTKFGKCWQFSLPKDNKYFFHRTVELSQRLYEEFAGGAALFPQEDLTLFIEQTNQIKETKVFPIDLFEQHFLLFIEYVEKQRAAGLLNEEQYQKLNNKTFVRSLLESLGIEFEKRVLFTISKEKFEMINDLNARWNPSAFLEDEGIIPLPFMVFDADEKHDL